jgi:2-C-methyl-D-erythritol 4-phosphate cytidylyltransferase
VNGLLLVAAGSGQRFGGSVPKALVEVGGDSLVGHCLHTARAVKRIDKIVVVAPPDHARNLAAQLSARFGQVTAIAGGASRDESVRNGLAALSSHTRFVLVHDAARPFAPVEVFDRVLDALHAGAEAVVPGIPVVDTVKVVRAGRVERTLTRADLMAVQTPQGFHRRTLVDAHSQCDGSVTDDAMLVERAGVPVLVVPGSPDSLKITTQFDLRIAELIAEQNRSRP